MCFLKCFNFAETSYLVDELFAFEFAFLSTVTVYQWFCYHRYFLQPGSRNGGMHQQVVFVWSLLTHFVLVPLLIFQKQSMSQCTGVKGILIKQPSVNFTIPDIIVYKL